MVRWQKRVFIHAWLSRAYLALARLSCFFRHGLYIRYKEYISKMYIVYGYELELCRLHLTYSDVASNLSSGALLTPEF